jgi:hypothetical protein
VNEAAKEMVKEAVKVVASGRGWGWGGDYEEE